MLHDRVADPVDTSIVSDDFVIWIHHDDLVPLVHCIRSDPIRVEDTKTSTLAPNTLFGNAAKVAACLDLVDALVGWFSIHNTLGNALLATTTFHAHAVDQIALLCLVAKFASLISTSRT